MRLRLVYFAWVREAIGQDEEAVPRPAPGTTIAMLLGVDAPGFLAGQGVRWLGVSAEGEVIG